MPVKPTLAQLILNATLGGKSILVVSGGDEGDVLVQQEDGTYAPEAQSVGGSGDVVGPESAVDNAAARFDTTTGKLIQESSWLIHDNLTASPNNTVNHACIEATGGTTNVSVSIKPKGTGAFCLSAPDGTATGGNVRGLNAVDLRSAARVAASHVASGVQSFLGPYGSIASAEGSVNFCVGTSSGQASFLAASTSLTALVSGTRAAGFARDGGTVSGSNSFGHGNIPGFGSGDVSGAGAVGFSGALASGGTSFAHGYYAASDRHGMYSHACGAFSYGGFGEAQRVGFVLRNKTTNNTAATLFLDGASTRLTIPSGKVMSAVCRICGIKSDGTAVANYMRRVVIKNLAGTTSLVGAVETIGIDIEDNASTDVAITADDTNDALQINVTGITGETWRWVAVVEGLEIAYGT